MVGFPKRRALRDALKANGGEDKWIYEPVAAGATFQAIADSLLAEPAFADALKGSCTRGFIYNYVHWGEKREAKWQAAKKASAGALAEQGLEILDEVARDENGNLRDLSSGTAAAARNRAAYRQWLASVRDSDEYAEKKDPALVVNVNALHLDALRQAGSMKPLEGRELKALPKPEPTE